MTSPAEPPTAAPDLAPPGPEVEIEPVPARSSFLARFLVIAAVLIVVIGVIGANIHLPYVIFSPGDATPVDDYLTIRGARTYGHDGSLLLLTVRVSRDRPNLWRFIDASLDGDADVVGEEKVFGSTPRKQADQQDEAAMSESQVTAKQAALTRLGYDVRVTGDGVVIGSVAPNSPASEAGLEPDDRIVSIGAAPIALPCDVGELVRAEPVGTTFPVTVERDDAEQTIDVTSAKAPSGAIAGKPYFGIAAGAKNQQVEFPIDVTIKPGEVSGPSGGLAFALTIVDALTPGDLTGGRKVAVTGTVDGCGEVGAVGGVPQKTIAARDAGATLMLVPRSEVRAAKKRAGGLKVVGVDTLDDALAALHAHGGQRVAQPPD